MRSERLRQRDRRSVGRPETVHGLQHRRAGRDTADVLLGGTQLRHLDEFFRRLTGVQAYLADEPLFCVAKGTGLILSHLDVYKRTLLNKR